MCVDLNSELILWGTSASGKNVRKRRVFNMADEDTGRRSEGL